MNTVSRVFLLLISIVFFSSCASIHSDYYGNEVRKDGSLSNDKKTDMGLVISVEEDIDMSSAYFGMLYFTFENKTQNWIRIKNIRIDFKSDAVNPNVRFTSGYDLKAWYASIIKKKQISEFNRQMFLGTMSVIGGIMATTSGNKTARAIGATAFMGAMTSLSVDEYRKSLDRVQKTKIFPENHLFYNQFVVPPGLFQKKWLVLNSANHKKTGYLSYLYIVYKTMDGKEETVRLQFRSPYHGYSQWQKDMYKSGRDNVQN